MYEQLGLEWLSPMSASAILGLCLGAAFGAVALRTRFCLRRALVSDNLTERRSAAGVWLSALAVALAVTQAAVLTGWIDFSAHRFHKADLPYAMILAGGLLFGAGMVLTNGCASRLSVLAGSGNTRAVFVLLIFAITAHATLKGVLAPVRVQLANLTLDISALTTLLYTPLSTTGVLLVVLSGLVVLIVKLNANRREVLGGALIGVLVPLGWVGTGLVLQDDFDPIVFQSLSFTSPSTEWLFWSIASTSISAGFGVGLVGGVLIGSAVTAMISREFKWVSFQSPAQTGRYALGGSLMGVGGVLAGGCTVGAGLSGVSSLSISALLALSFIAIGALVTDSLLHKKHWPPGKKNGPLSSLSFSTSSAEAH